MKSQLKIGLSIAAIVLTAALALRGADAPTTEAAGEKSVSPSGLTIIKINKQTEPMITQAGDSVWVHYTGRLQASGTKFDSSVDREPLNFTLGQGMVIKGWDEGILGMQVGDKRQLIVPPNLAYGAKGAGDAIPPNAVLVFDVELIGIKRTPKS